MGDAYFFINELTKTTATSPVEQALFTNYLNSKKKRDAKYGKIAVSCLAVPYFGSCFMYGGWAWKFATFYGLLTTLDATYDVGMYVNFFINGIPLMRKLMALDSSESFSPI